MSCGKEDTKFTVMDPKNRFMNGSAQDKVGLFMELLTEAILKPIISTGGHNHKDLLAILEKLSHTIEKATDLNPTEEWEEAFEEVHSTIRGVAAYVSR